MSFDTLFEKLMGHEGGYVNDPRDPGGETKFGISKRAYPDVDIKGLTLDAAKAIYKRDYWDKLPAVPDRLRAVMFDCAVNTGLSRAVRLLQRAIGTPADGKWGTASDAALHKIGEDLAVKRFSVERILFYAELPTFSTYGRGWVLRVLDVMEV